MAQPVGGESPAAAVGGPDQPLTIGLQEITTYDTNPARGSALNASLRGIKADEVILSPSLTVGYSHTSGLQGLSVLGDFGYDYHAKNSILNREHLDFSVAGSKTVGSFCSVGATGKYSRGQTDLQYLTIDVTDNTFQDYRVGVSESCGASSGLTENVQVSRSTTQNSSSSLDDYNTTSVSGMIGYSSNLIGVAGLVLSYSKSDYVKVPENSEVIPESLKVTSVGVQLTRPIGMRLSGAASVSYSHTDENVRVAAGLPGVMQSAFNGVTASTSLTYQAGPRLLLTAHASRNVSATILQNVGYTLVTEADLAASYTVSSRIGATLGTIWSRNVYNDVDPLIQSTTPQNQEQTTVYGQISVKVGGRSAVSFDIRHQQARSDVAFYDYTDNRASLTLSTAL